MTFRTSSHPIGILTKSAPSSMRREQTRASRGMLGAELSAGSSPDGLDGVEDPFMRAEDVLGRSCNSTGGILESTSVEDFGELADTLKFNVAMRREVHLGLAKALHTDFGQHDFHPDESDEDDEGDDEGERDDEYDLDDAPYGDGNGAEELMTKRRCEVM